MIDRRAALCLLGGAGASLAGCGRQDGITRLSFWAMGAEGTSVQTLMPAFEAAHPGIRVEVQPLPWTSAHQKLLTAYAGNAMPDLSQIGNTWVAELSAIGALSPTPAFAADLGQDQFPAVLETNAIGGRSVATPWYVDTRLIFYRTDLLARAGFDAMPTTWAAWKAAMHAVKRVAGNGNFAILLPVNEFEQLLTFGLQGDQPLLRDENTRGNFSSPSFQAALAFYKSLFDEGLAPLASSTQISNVWTEFARGYFSFYFSGPWTIGDMKTRLPPEVQPHWTTAGVPGPTGPGASAPGGSSLAVFRSSPNQEAAWKLVRFLSDPVVQAEFNVLTGDLPARPSAWSAPQVATDPYIAAFKGQLARAKAVPKVPEWERIVSEMQIVAERMVRGEFTVAAASAEIDRRADRLLEKRRWMIEQGAGGVIAARERAAWGFVAPSLIAIAVFFVVPVVSAMLLSLTDFDIYALADLGNLRFVGLQNYERLLTNPLFWGAMKNTLWFSALGVPLAIAMSLAAAVILNARTVKWRPIWRVVFFAPYVTTLVATAVLWNYLLHTKYGVINWAITSVGLPAVDWLGDPRTSIPAILLFVVWKIFGYNMLIFLAVLQTVPDDLYEAARIDGAGPWDRFRHVTLPAIAPTLLLVSIISVAGFFQLFAEPYVMTQGGPAQSTVTVLYFMYEEGFKWWNLGSASAVAFILFLCIFAVTMIQLAVSRRLGGDHT